MRLYAKAFVDNHRQKTVQFLSGRTDGQVDDESFIQQIDEVTFETDNLLGPRYFFDEPIQLYDRVVNGQHYSITVQDMGWDRLPPVLFGRFGIPEPSSVGLALIAASGGLAFWWKRRMANPYSSSGSDC